MIRVGMLGLSRRVGTFSEVGLRSWEEAGCAAVERVLMKGDTAVYLVHRPLVIRGGRSHLQRIMRDWCDTPHQPSRCDLILTIGGTGYSSIDVMPEATQPLLRRSMPAIIEVMRHVSLCAGHHQESASRGVAGTRGRTLLINIPGIARGMADEGRLTLATQALMTVLPDILAGILESPEISSG